jgi:hypothetical protein
MRHGKIRLPSPAMVVSMVALFVALGGVGYAAVTLPRGSVGAAQLRTAAVTETKIAAGAVRSFKIRTNAISTTKVANNSLTGADILESSLGPVPKVTGLNNTPLTRAVATAGANEAAARVAAPEIPLLTRGQLSVYGKCLKDSAVNQVRAEIFVKTTVDGAILQGGGVTLDGGDGSLFLNVGTPEINRRTDSEVAAVNAASAASNGFVAISPDGTAIRSLLYSGAKNGTLAGPAGQGLYGAGDGCLFGGFVAG